MSWITVFTNEEKEFSGFLDCSWSSLYWMEDLACLSCSSIINLQMQIVKTFRNKHVFHDLPDKLLIVKTLLWLLWELFLLAFCLCLMSQTFPCPRLRAGCWGPPTRSGSCSGEPARCRHDPQTRSPCCYCQTWSRRHHRSCQWQSTPTKITAQVPHGNSLEN